MSAFTDSLDNLLKKADRTYVTFGKYRGAPLSDLASDTGYLRWLLTLTGDGVAAEFAYDNRAAILGLLNAEANAKAADAGPVNVTEHQQEAVNKLYDLILSGVPVVRLSGGAGYGKSYAIKKLLLQLREKGINSCAAATSYVATQVLAQGLDPYGFESATIARTIKLAKIFDNGSESYEMTQDSWDAARELMSDDRALVIDEDSMVADNIAQMLMDANNGGTLILVGDRYQLPPVGQDRVSICCDTPAEHTAELTEPMRYSKESLLYGLEQTARHAPDRLIQALDTQDANTEILRVPTPDALISTYVANYKADLQATHRMLLFRRRDVTDANNNIRALLYGYFADDVEGGERLMVLRTSDYPYVAKAKLGDTTRYYSGEAFTVQDCTQAVHLGIPHWLVKFQGRNDPVRVVFAISETQMDESILGGVEYAHAIKQASQSGRETKNWEPWKQLQSDFLAVAYTYCTSIHRAQGQTVDYAYSMPGQMMAVKGLLGRSLMYVALTRARKQCVVRV